jgi:hypothetical protein
MNARATSAALAVWAGSITAPLAWGIHHQGLADAVYFDCGLGNPANALGLGIGMLVLSFGAALLSWTARGSGEDGEARNRRFIGGLSAGMGLLFGLAITYQTLAGVLIPGCLR